MIPDEPPLTSQPAFVHPLAHVAKTAYLGRDTVVWQFASVIRHSVVGDRCKIGSCSIVDGARVGDGTTISHGTFISPGTVIGNYAFIGPNVSFCNDMWPSVSKVGFDLDQLIVGEIITTRVEDGANLGVGVIVLPGVIIGLGSMIAAGAVVDRPVPPGCLFKRDGEIVKLEPSRTLRRMRII